MQDNAPAHNARATREWLENEGIPTINWPAHSPDLNLIKHERKFGLSVLVIIIIIDVRVYRLSYLLFR
jgi:hypothetical protein